MEDECDLCSGPPPPQFLLPPPPRPPFLLQDQCSEEAVLPSELCDAFSVSIQNTINILPNFITQDIMIINQLHSSLWKVICIICLKVAKIKLFIVIQFSFMKFKSLFILHFSGSM